MKILGLIIVLTPTVLATSESASAHGDLRRPTARYVKTVSVERNVDDDHTDGYDTKTVTTERNVDDDNTDGSSSHTKMKKAAAGSTNDIPKDAVATSSTKSSTRMSSGKHHNSTADDSNTGTDDDDSASSNLTSPISDMMDVLNGNMDHDNTTIGGDGGGSKIVLPSEHEPSEMWIIAIVALFSSMAVSLCITTAIRRCRKNNRRTGYQEVNNIVV